MTRKTREEIGELTPEEIEQLDRLAALPDSEIDTSDIPEITDFSHAVRGDAARREIVRWQRPGAKPPMPVFLKAELEDYLTAAAERRGIGLSELVNDMLEKDVAIAEAVK
jgi:hypothetical protein